MFPRHSKSNSDHTFTVNDETSQKGKGIITAALNKVCIDNAVCLHQILLILHFTNSQLQH